jgi:predicted lipid-binding transport protein (Tim44 family)
MVGDFWSELFKSVGSLLQSNQREFVFVDEDQLASSILNDPSLTQPGAGAQSAPSMQTQAKAALEGLQKADPDFSEADFLIEASKAFNAVLAAEGAMDASGIATFVTPNFLTGFQQRLDGFRSGGFTRTVSEVKLDPPSTMRVAVGGAQESITVRFTGSAVRNTKEDMTGLLTEGSASAESFTEFATFVRPAGSTTPKHAANGGALHCPSCGAPIDDGALKCAFCGAPLTGTGGTWLLDRLSSSAYT